MTLNLYHCQLYIYVMLYLNNFNFYGIYLNLLIMITLYFHWKSVKWIISKIETSDIFILKHLITLEKLRLLDRYFCFFWIDFVTNLWNVGVFFLPLLTLLICRLMKTTSPKRHPPWIPLPRGLPIDPPGWGAR